MDMGINKCLGMELQICLGHWQKGTPAFLARLNTGHFEALQKGSGIRQMQGTGHWRSASFHNFTKSN
jgi:hypothetical protein